MLRTFFATLALLCLAGSAEAGSFVVPRPPSVLSPDLTGPWLMQLGPHGKPRISEPAPPVRRAVFGTNAPVAAQVPTARNYHMNPAFLPAIVQYPSDEKPGTIIIDTEARYLYLILGDGQAKRYGVGVGRPGFEWAGVHKVSRKAEWPSWTPPEEMRQRQPYLPVSMKGGIGNPLGARAMYLGSTLYRIHGTNQPWTIGHAVSSGCIRLRNQDVIDLYNRVKVGAKVIVM